MLKEKFHLKRIIHLLLFFVLLLSVIVLLVNWPKHDTLVKQIETSASQIDSTHPINRKIELLSVQYGDVDNKFREFVITKDAKIFKQYQTGIQELIVALDSLNKYSENEVLLANIKSGLRQKDSINTILISLHKQLDTLLNKNPEEIAPQVEYSFIPYKTESVVKSIEVDTIKSTKKKKGLFGRLGDAFKNKQNKDALEKLYFKFTVNKKQTVSGNVIDQMDNFGDLLNAYYRDYFRKIGEQQATVKKKELQLVLANKQILSNLDNLFKSYKFLGKEADKNLHKQNIDSTIEAGLQLEKIVRILLALLLLVIGLLLLYSYLASKHEKQIQEEKEKSDNHAKIREHLLATMSHEIRTPINSIIGYSSLLEKENLPTTAADNLSSIAFSSNSLLNIVNSTLDFLKTQKNLMTFSKVPFKPKEEILKTTNSLRVLALKKNIDFVVENLIPDNTVLLGDVAKLHQVIYNLSGNAIKFTDKGKVVIRASAKPTSENNQRISVSISDSGIGMSEENIKRIFEPYFQIENNKTSQGTGLGLAICNELVKLQGGKIEVTSTLGKGSTFNFYIDYPIANKIETTTETTVSSAQENKTVHNVFIVDDDAFQLAWIKKALTSQNLNVHTFSNATEALNKIKDLQPKFIFTDINMPEMDGVGFLNEVKKQDTNQSVKIIACSGESDAQILEEYKTKGFNFVLTKPIKTEDLVKIIHA